MSFFSTLLHTNTKCKVGGGPRPPSFVCCNDHEAIGHTDRYFTKSIIDTIYRGFCVRNSDRTMKKMKQPLLLTERINCRYSWLKVEFESWSGLGERKSKFAMNLVRTQGFRAYLRLVRPRPGLLFSTHWTLVPRCLPFLSFPPRVADGTLPFNLKIAPWQRHWIWWGQAGLLHEYISSKSLNVT